jgi:hypothetical protein
VRVYYPLYRYETNMPEQLSSQGMVRMNAESPESRPPGFPEVYTRMLAIGGRQSRKKDIQRVTISSHSLSRANGTNVVVRDAGNFCSKWWNLLTIINARPG